MPDRLLHRHWPGRRAKQLFDARHHEWSPAAVALFDAFERSGERRDGR
ncbi:MAG: PaaX family transcriptional regulator C-terminal domain-containing protein [Ilumatobacteraceae bacterium]